MFAAGNGTERMRFAKIKAVNETVIDMFSGIGYFTLPLSKHSGLTRLIALEKNPDSAGFLRKNVVLNKVEDKVTVYEGDNREVAQEWVGKCDRVLMGCVFHSPGSHVLVDENSNFFFRFRKRYLPSAEPFIDRALEFGKPDRFVIHYHYIATKAESESMPRDHIEPKLHAQRPNAKMIIDHIENVKSYAPQLFHYVADVTIVS